MGRKTKNSSEEEELDVGKLSEDGKLIVMILEQKMEKMVSSLTDEIRKRDEKIEMLEQEVVNLKHGMIKLDEKLNDAEAYERRDVLVVSGSAVPVVTQGENVFNVVSNMLRDKLRINVKSSDVSTAHRMGLQPKSQAEDRRRIVIKFCRREIKQEIISVCKRTKPEGLFINEDLTPTRSRILYALRKAKRRFQNIIASCGSHDGKVHVYIKPPNPSAGIARNTKVTINSQEQLQKFCERTLEIEAKELIDD